MGGPRTLGEMASAERVRPPTMSRLVSEMERAGLVRRSRDPHDARVVRVDMSAKGRDLLARGRKLRIAELERRLAALTPAERATIAAAVAAIETMLRE